LSLPPGTPCIYGRRAVKTQLSYLLANCGTLANNYMCRPLYRPSSGCAFYCNVTIQYTQSIIDDEISFLAMVNEISSSITGTVYIVQLLYSKKHNLMMADIEAETCSC
jgi:hypothetical protein